MSSISTHLDARRLSDLARDPNHVASAIANFEAARDAHPRLAAERAILDTAAQALNVAHRPTYEPGVYPGLCGDLRAELGDDDYTEEQAESDATDYILSHAESMADWLAKACDTPAGREPLDVRALEPVQIMEGAAPMLMAVLMNGDNTQALRALHRLRELAAVEFKREIDERAASLLREVA